MKIATRRHAVFLGVGAGALLFGLLTELPLLTAISGMLERQAILEPLLSIGSLSTGFASLFASWRVKRFRKRATKQFQIELKNAYRQVLDRHLAIIEETNS